MTKIVKDFKNFVNEETESYFLEDDMERRNKFKVIDFKEFFELAEEKGLRPEFAKKRPNLGEPNFETSSDSFEITTPNKGEVFFVEKGSSSPFVEVRRGFTTNTSGNIMMDQYNELLDELLELDSIKTKYFSFKLR